MKLKILLQKGQAQLADHKIENPGLNIGLILQEVTGIKRLSIPLHYEDEVNPNQIKTITEMLDRRCKNEPLQYIFGYTEFYGHKILLNPQVLIPRPETEYLIEIIKNTQLNPQRILDIGTGSGAIAISLKAIFPHAQVVGLDISLEALKLARKNAQLNDLEIDFIQADIYKAQLGKFDLLVSNPPYISQEDYAILPDEVKRFEPQLALVGLESGLYFYRKIIEMSHLILTDQGHIFFEIGEKQGLEITNLAQKYNFKQVNIIPDLVGRDRIISMTN